MSANTIKHTIMMVLLLGGSTAFADSYEPEDYQPPVSYTESQVKSEPEAVSPTKREAVTTDNVVKPRDVERKTIDSAYIQPKAVAEPSITKETSSNPLPFALLALAAAGFVWFRRRPSNKSNTFFAVSEAKTGVSRYLEQIAHPKTGVEKYLENQVTNAASSTRVGRYIDRLNQTDSNNERV